MIHPVECPFCGLTFENNADYVDVGWGGGPSRGIQVTGNVCDRCNATERGGNRRDGEIDEATGWYPPAFIGPDAAWMATILENVFAAGVRRGMHLAPAPGGPPPDTLAPTLAIAVVPAPIPADVPF